MFNVPPVSLSNAPPVVSVPPEPIWTVAESTTISTAALLVETVTVPESILAESKEVGVPIGDQFAGVLTQSPVGLFQSYSICA